MARRLKDWLQSYLQYTEYSEAPTHFNFWAGITAIGGALQRKAFIDQIYFRWTPNFYTIFVAPSGVATKSTALDNAMDLLRELPNVHFGPNAMTWQAVLLDLQQAQEQIFMDDGELELQSCLTFSSRELGVLLDPQDRNMLDVLVDLWDGKDGSWRKATATMGDQVAKNPWLNIIAGTTPSWIADNMSQHVIGGGFTSRCLFVFGDRKKHLVAYPKREAERRQSLAWVAKLRADLIHDLEQINAIKGEYELTPEAEEFGIQWYEDIYNNPNRELQLNNFDGYLARKQGHVHKVALTVAAAYKDERIITLSDLQTAIALVESLEKDMPKVFRHIKADALGLRVDDIIHILQIHKRMDRQALYRLVFHKMAMPKAEFDTIIDSAVHAGLVSTGAEMMLTFIHPQDSPDHKSDKEVHSDELKEGHVREASGS